MKNILVVLVAMSLSWTQQKDNYVEIYGISFTCPAGWNVKKAEDDGSFKSISVERAGDIASGLITMLFTEMTLEPDALLDLLVTHLKNQDGHTNLAVQAPEEKRYGKYNCKAITYAFLINSVKHDGEIVVFSEKGITMSIVHQDAVLDHSENLPGFITLRESLTIK